MSRTGVNFNAFYSYSIPDDPHLAVLVSKKPDLSGHRDTEIIVRIRSCNEGYVNVFAHNTFL